MCALFFYLTFAAERIVQYFSTFLGLNVRHANLTEINYLRLGHFTFVLQDGSGGGGHYRGEVGGLEDFIHFKGGCG